jgi:molybdenum cofactor cytidylyltransferase
MISRIGCVVLAGGPGSRFPGDRHKLLVPLGGKPLAQHAIDAAAQCDALSCTLVLGANAEQLAYLLDTRRCAVVVNEGWREGIAASLRAGLARHRDDDACIFLVADQPFVSFGDLNALIKRFRRHSQAILALRAGRVWGAPVLFPRRDFGALLRLRGDAGAKRYALTKRQRLLFVPASDARAFEDIDTPEDARRVSGQYGGSPAA